MRRRPSPSAATPAAISDAYRSYVLGLLLVVYVFNFLDRQILAILLEPIKQEFALSDAQLGLLGGLAFAFFYTLLGIPIAMWADRGERKNIVALALLVWSAMTAVTGMATSFATLLLARIGVGIGEAGGSPPSHSLLSDYFPPHRRGFALGVYSAGIPIGASIGALAGGWIGASLGWRAAFMVVGLPGVALALVVFLTLREPRRGHSEGGAEVAQAETLADVLRFLLRLRSFRHLAFAAALHAFFGYGAANFLPSFLARVHEMPLGLRGTLFAVILLSGGIGNVAGGRLADRYGAGDARWYFWVPGIATLLAAPAAAAFYLWPTPYVAVALGCVPTILGAMYLGPTLALTQTLVRPRMRALASAILLFIVNMIGLGGGPTFVGWLSDRLGPAYGDEAIRYALLVTVVAGALWAPIHYWAGARTVREDLRAKDHGPARTRPGRNGRSDRRRAGATIDTG
jgi:predicted MFS family arabinose efflux permease